jgi:anti-sigma factor RsiW
MQSMWDYLDWRLDAASADRLREHLEACRACSRYHTYQVRLKRRLAALDISRRGTPNQQNSLVRSRVARTLASAGWKPTRRGRGPR